MKNVLIYGASGHSKMIIDCIHKNNSHQIVGLIDSFKSVGEELFGYKVLGNLDDLKKIQDSLNVDRIVIGIGQNFTRFNIWKKITKISPKTIFDPIIHPSAILAENTVIEEGAVIMPGAIVNADARVGKFCILNTNSSLGHDAVMDDFSSIASGAAVGGNVKIGKCTALSLKAGIIQNVTIGEHTVIAAGAIVVKDLGSYKLAMGVPANKISDRKVDDKYLGK